MIVDAHTHVFPPSFHGRRSEMAQKDRIFGEMYSNPKSSMISFEQLINAMDMNGIDIAVVTGIGWENPELGRESNAYIAEAIHKYPKRLVGFCSVNPIWGDAALTEIEACAGDGFRGVGELHFQSWDTTIQSIVPMAEVASRLEMPLLVHSSEPAGHVYAGKGTFFPSRLLAMIHACPTATIIAAHWGGGLPFYGLMPEVADSIRNVFFDSAASSLLYSSRVFSVVADLVNPDKILFGTDFPLVKPLSLIKQIRASGLTPEIQNMILGGNACRLLGLNV